MATAIGLGFTLSASAQRMASGINAGVVELQKLGYQAKKTSSDVSVLKNLAIGQALISGIRSTAQQFTSFIKSAAGSAAAVDDLSKRTGISTQTLQGYGLAANQSGVSTETMGKSLQKLSLVQLKAQKNNEAAKASFTAIGLTMKDLAGLSPEQTFEAVTDAIAELPTIAQQSAAAIALFGKSGGELLPIFQEGTGYLAKMRKEAEELGIVLSKEQMSGLAGLDDMIAKVTMAFGGLSQRIVAELVPQLLAAGEQMLTFVKTLDITAVTKALAAAINIATAAFTIFTSIALPLATTILPPIAAVMTIISDNMTGAAIGAGLAAVAYGAYSIACVGATAATAALAVSIRAMLASTGIGALVVGFGLLTGAVIEYFMASDKSSDADTKAAKARLAQTDAANKARNEATKSANQKQVTKLLNDEKIRKQFDDVTKDGESFQKKLQDSLQIKSTVSLEVNDVRTKQGAADVLEIQRAQTESAKQAQEEASKLSDANAKAANARLAQSDAAKKAQNEAIQSTKKGTTAAREQAESANKARDKAIQAGKQVTAASITSLKQQADAAKKAQEEAVKSAKQKQVTKLLNEQRISQQFDDVEKSAEKFRKTLQNSLQIKTTASLEVSDIRTKEGAAAVFALQAGRVDPAVEAAREQIKKLEEIKKAIRENKADETVDILGGAE